MAMSFNSDANVRIVLNGNDTKNMLLFGSPVLIHLSIKPLLFPRFLQEIPRKHFRLSLCLTGSDRSILYRQQELSCPFLCASMDFFLEEKDLPVFCPEAGHKIRFLRVVIDDDVDRVQV